MQAIDIQLCQTARALRKKVCTSNTKEEYEQAKTEYISWMYEHQDMAMRVPSWEEVENSSPLDICQLRDAVYTAIGRSSGKPNFT
jgi:hypothetical protein